MSFEAKALYDFEAVGEGELTLRIGDVITVTDTNVGQGWWMATNGGNEGIIPEAYVERLPDPSGAPPSYPPPPLTRKMSETQRSDTNSWGDDWDSEEEHRYEDPKELMGPPSSLPKSSSMGSTYESMGAGAAPGGGGWTNTNRPRNDSSTNRPDSTSAGKGFTFGNLFGKSGQVNDYLTGLTESNATLAKEAVNVKEEFQGVFTWEWKKDPYTVTIGSPKKGSKFGGMKSFIAYQVTPSFSNIQVSRRYKHFDWLHEILTKKFGSVIAIPPLPDKQVTGRFDEDLIEHRRIELQSFADRICRHPVLAHSEVWMHFITETDEKKWTRGKRAAENDPLAGTAFLTTIQAPAILSETEILVDDKITRFAGDVAKLDGAVKGMYKTADEQIVRFRSTHKKDYQDIGKAFNQLGTILGDQAPCLNKIGDCYDSLSDVMDKQVMKDWEPVQHLMHDYRGLTGGWQTILGFFHGVKDKQKEIEKEGGEKERDSAVARVNTYRVGVGAEQNFFQQELGLDINHTCQAFLAEQIAFHNQMSERLTSLYHSCWSGEGAGDGAGVSVGAVEGAGAPQQAQQPPQPQSQQPMGLDAW